MTSASKDDLNAYEFIVNHRVCYSHEETYRMMSLKQHYFLMDKNRKMETAPTSIVDVFDSATIMLKEYQDKMQTVMKSFIDEYMDISSYTTHFRVERFESFNNIVWTSMTGLFDPQNPNRFTDWVDDRSNKVILNEFTGLIGTQRSLIEEFAQMQTKVDYIKKTYPMSVGTFMQTNENSFEIMKQQTIEYLAFIFIAAFEYKAPEEFSSNDNILPLYWSHFYDWLEVNNYCDRLLNGGMNGVFKGITNLPQLQHFLKMEANHETLDKITLSQDSNIAAQLSAVMPEAVHVTQMTKWSFFNEQNLNDVIEYSIEQEVINRVDYDKIRLETRGNCLDTVSTLESFKGLKWIATMKSKYTSHTIYYYLVEHFWYTVMTGSEFKDKEVAKRAIQVIYIFINHMMNTESEELQKRERNLPELIIYIIVRILNGMEHDGDLVDKVNSDVLDDPVRNDIYLLFLMITENNDLPKPDESDELNKGKNNGFIDEDETDPSFRIDPRHKKYMTVIRRMYKLAGGNNIPKFIRRYKKKYYSMDLLKNNPIFAHDAQFYELELAMNQEFQHNDKDFKITGKNYHDAIVGYLTKYLKVDTKNNKKTNYPLMMLVKYFADELKTLNKSDKSFNSKKDKILLSQFTQMQSNFMENQYMEAVLLTCKTFKLSPPDFDVILANTMEDTDRLNMFEFIKRIITNLKHNKSKGVDKFLDTVDINTSEFVDESGITNGERFRTMILDIEKFFKPELKILSEIQGPTNKAQVNYSDLTNILKFLEQQFHLVKDPNQSPLAFKEMNALRMMMEWNIFDDLNEYMPLLGNFVEETKGADPNGANPLKVEIAVENYNSLYLIILEHRLFCAKHKFSFSSGQDRLDNLYRYLQYKDEDYENYFSNALPEKEVRFSKLSARQVQNTLYFLKYRIKKILPEEKQSLIRLSDSYYPYSFREIYLLISNHNEVKENVNNECVAIWKQLQFEKIQRSKDYTKNTISEEFKKASNYKFCILMAFNKYMMELIESQAQDNSKQDDHMKTLTIETIFEELVVPFYDKMSAHELIIQVFNLNMTHAKAAASESIEKFSNYIALLDRFLYILDDLEDGVNDTIVLKNFPKGAVSDTMKEFCLLLEKSNDPERTRVNMIFIRRLLNEKLKPGMLNSGQSVYNIYKQYVPQLNNNEQFISKLNDYTTQIRYGVGQDGISIGLVQGGDNIDMELFGMLMIYSPHSEFTAQMIYENNFMSALPGYIKSAQDNETLFYQNHQKATNMTDIFNSCFERKSVLIKKAIEFTDEEITDDLNNEDTFDFNLDDFINDEDEETHDLDDEQMIINNENEYYTEHDSVVQINDLDSNVQKVDNLAKVLVKEEITQIELNSQESHLEGRVVELNEYQTEENNLISVDEKELLQSMSSNDSFKIQGLNIVSDNLDYAEEEFADKNFKQYEENGKQHTRVVDTHETSQHSFMTNSVKSRVQSSTSCVIKLRVGFSSLKPTAESLEQLKQVTNRMTQNMNMTSYKVKVLSPGNSKLTSQRASHIMESIESFNEVNKNLHQSSSQNANMVIVQDGMIGQHNFSTTNLNGVYAQANSQNPLAKSKNAMILENIVNVKQRAKSLTDIPSELKRKAQIMALRKQSTGKQAKSSKFLV